MRMHIKFSQLKLKITEIGFIFLVWLVSVVVSSQAFIFNRPVNPPPSFEWIHTHTLVSIRNFDYWGFWKLLGASTLFPNGYELTGVDLTTFTKPLVYLSYPSLWLIPPYIVFKLLNLLPFSISLSPEYLQVYNLVFNRLLCAVVIYYLYLEIIKIITRDTLTGYKQRLIAFLGLVGWLFTPPVLYWTQNLYFTDEAVLLPVYIIFLISLKCRFKFARLSNFSKVVLFFASILACGFDWYGWVAVAVILIIKLIDELLSNEISLFFSKNLLKQYFNSVKFILLGVIVSGFTYIAQLFYYKDGLRQIIGTFSSRSSAMSTDSRVPLTLFTMLRGIAMHWTSYFPRMVQPFFVRILDSDSRKALDADPILLQTLDESKQIGFIAAFVVLSIGFIFFLFCLYYLYKKSKYSRYLLYAYGLVLLVPLIQIFLLKQHSYMHYFSAFKMGLPITFSLLVLPAVTLSQILPNALSKTRFSSWGNNSNLSAFITVLGIVIVIGSVGEFKQFASINTLPSKGYDIGLLLTRNVTPMELPITDVPNLVVESFPTEAIWYGEKYVYSYGQLKDLRRRANPEILNRMQPIFLTYKAKTSTASVSSICQGKWIDLAEKVENREIVACKAAELNRLLDGSYSPQITASPASVDTLGVKSISEIDFKPAFVSAKSTIGYFDAMYVDALNVSLSPTIEVPQSTFITASGWAVITTEGKPADSVIITQGENNSLVAVVPVNLARPDVSKALNNPAYTNSGWIATINPSILPNNKKVVLKAWAYNSATKEATQLNSTYDVVAVN